MAAASEENCNLEREIATFFTKTTATRSACDLHAKALVGGEVTAVPVQGVCSYTVYAGKESEIVVQFRLRSLALPLDVLDEAHRVYGQWAPHAELKGYMGDEDPSGVKEVLCVYVMPRMKGISQLQYLLDYGYPLDAPQNKARRLIFITDLARLDQHEHDKLHQSYETDLRRLLIALPERFHSLLDRCLDSLPAIMDLPKVLTHRDLSSLNILVDPDTCHLSGVIDWAEARVEPFGTTLHFAQWYMGHFHMRHGVQRYPDHDVLNQTFWRVLREEVGGWTDEVARTVETAMIMSLFLMRGFTTRLANEPEPKPIKDDESGAYNFLYLDGYLIDPRTRII